MSWILQTRGPQIAFAGIVLSFNREMRDPKRVWWLTLLSALGLVYIGIDRMFFDRIERALAHLVGTLLVAVSIAGAKRKQTL
jgi:hypothetical protein